MHPSRKHRWLKQKLNRPNPRIWAGFNSGEDEEAAVVDDMPAAMVLMPDDDTRQQVVRALEDKPLQVVLPGSVDEAVSSMRFRDFAVVVYHSQYEDKPLENQDFYRFMMYLGMAKRRQMYYILVGPEFQTFF